MIVVMSAVSYFLYKTWHTQRQQYLWILTSLNGYKELDGENHKALTNNITLYKNTPLMYSISPQFSSPIPFLHWWEYKSYSSVLKGGDIVQLVEY